MAQTDGCLSKIPEECKHEFLAIVPVPRYT